ncbi:MAG: glutamate 5-kinase [PVC group bacterium]
MMAENGTGRESLAKAQRIVVKVGSRLLTGGTGSINERLVGRLAGQLADLKREEREVLLVTSGAIAAGRQELKMKSLPGTLPDLQAAAAVGQAILMHIYHRHFRREGFSVGQILLTRDGLHNRDRHLNARHTLQALLEKGIIPIINENDTVAVDEIKFGDNDHLAAQVANLIRADLLILLTDVDGLLRPAARPGRNREIIRRVEKITPGILAMIEDAPREYSRGGWGASWRRPASSPGPGGRLSSPTAPGPA